MNEIKNKSINDHIPILRDKTVELIKQYIIKNDCSNILEIGTAYGYSAYEMSKLDVVKHIVSLELNKGNYEIASSFLKDNKKIKLVNESAFTFESKERFDLILIDGPKSHQEKLVEKYKLLLQPQGLMIIDNVYLKKFDSLPTLTKNQKKLVDNVNTFRKWLLDTQNAEIIDIDDGVAVVYNKNTNL
ncbi:MAG: hypothetical protein LBB95_00720 [Mycoplasmataceae bacterium]|nr:hypothetical protein [Mycoplasmataceae bacterium]